jgi:hypothetical protein
MGVEDNRHMVAYCGLNCRECRAYKATMAEDFEALTELASRWGEQEGTAYRPMDLECGGCRSDKLSLYCANCGVRDCGKRHRFETCAECSEYPCDRLSREWMSWKEADWTQAKAALDEMKPLGGAMSPPTRQDDPGRV